ncbi:MAG: YlxM family DNA-binding protein [Syntrophomonadaceae bacterium]|jgi:predicted DNA-binding protein YlxM (UPF0122 family)
MLEKLERVTIQKDLYGPLLTDKQMQVLNWYYEHDLSLNEIARHMKISKQAVYDLLKRSEKTLAEYEKRLGLVQRFQENRQQLEAVCSLLEGPCDAEARNTALQTLRSLLESM